MAENSEYDSTDPWRKPSKGEINENLMLKYVDGDCTQRETLKVERAMGRDEILRESIALLRAIIPNGTMISNAEISRLNIEEIRRSAHRGNDKPR